MTLYRPSITLFYLRIPRYGIKIFEKGLFKRKLFIDVIGFNFLENFFSEVTIFNAIANEEAFKFLLQRLERRDFDFLSGYFANSKM